MKNVVVYLLLAGMSASSAYMTTEAFRLRGESPAFAAKILQERLQTKTLSVEIFLPKEYRPLAVPVSGGKPFLDRMKLTGFMKSEGWAMNHCLQVDFVLDEPLPGNSFRRIRAYAYTAKTWYFDDLGTVTFADSAFYDACRDYKLHMTPLDGRTSALLDNKDVLAPSVLEQYQKDLESPDDATRAFAVDRLKRHDEAVEKYIQEQR